MRIQKHLPWWLTAIAIAIGFILIQVTFLMKLPVESGILGTVIFVVVFASPYLVLHWLYFHIGED